jgi:hypothetical protein
VIAVSATGLPGTSLTGAVRSADEMAVCLPTCLHEMEDSCKKGFRLSDHMLVCLRRR